MTIFQIKLMEHKENYKVHNRRNYSIKGILLLSLCLFIFGGCDKKEAIVPILEEPVAVKIDTEIAVRETIYDTDLYDGSVAPYTEGVFFTKDTQISEVMVSVGDYVTEGQTLISLERSNALEEIAALEKEINDAVINNGYSNEQASYDLDIAELQLTALTSSGTENEIEQKMLDIEGMQEKLSYAKKSQKLNLEQKQERMQLLQEKVDQRDLIAPFSGTVVYCETLYEGGTAQAYNPVIYMADDSRLSVKTPYIAADIINNSQEAYVLIGSNKFSITSSPYSKEEYRYRVYNKLTLETFFTVEDADDSLKSGMYAGICFVKNYNEDVLVVPKKSLYRDEDGRYVYKIVEGERVRQKVEIGSSTRSLTEITEGLSEGDEVYVQQ